MLALGDRHFDAHLWCPLVWSSKRAADLAPTIRQLQAAGNTTLRSLAAALNALSVETARGGEWDATQVRRLLARI
jgi:hypothetical protein